MAFPNHMKPMAKLANANPGVTVYVEHTGMPHDHTPEGLAVWREGMRALAAAPNVVCKLSGPGNAAPKWNEGIDPPLRPRSDRHLRHRLLYVRVKLSDRRRLRTMRAVSEAFFSIAKSYTAEERDKLFAANAIRHYRLAI
jgi:predicted TIM-barrel fold metal-dependent hydrolase